MIVILLGPRRNTEHDSRLREVALQRFLGKDERFRDTGKDGLFMRGKGRMESGKLD